ncbi:SPRY domain-containing SOCS box protein 2 isoform X2 [Pipistrellus kuhlii]|uniref:SPRY domain-containing SOCS box protein 2 isoform X2 n=1 Tax=Pipistrellus kuhlii TaxID=59472 RepID=UPI00174F2E3D|nr:SPRY domain-containing SOCS box protein 2 isoform X2 [Pipistrellus kuhlii]
MGPSRAGAQLAEERRPSKPLSGNPPAPRPMGQTALAGGSSSAPAPQALYPDHSCPKGLEELLSAPPPDLGTQRCHGWNPKDCSENIEVKEGGLCFERRPVAQSTDGVRGKRGYSSGLHAWEISWPREQRGTHAVVGVATARAPLQADHYAALLGSNSESWGWDLGRGKLYHQSKEPGAPQYPPGPQGEQLEVPERLQVVLDMEEGTLGYAIGGTYLGPAFRGLKGRTLYPAVSAVWGQCQVRIRYLGKRRAEPHTLLHLSRLCVRQALGATRLGQVSALPLPPAMKRYLLYQ